MRIKNLSWYVCTYVREFRFKLTKNMYLNLQQEKKILEKERNAPTDEV